jgi:ppGpp synthetase/RelA/SpoT-type nucleotidyltranferase
MAPAETAAAIYEAYRLRLDEYVTAAEEYERRVRRALVEAGLKPVTMTGRAKEPIELYKKQKRKSYSEFWAECPDVVGCRVVLSVADEKVITLQALERSDEITVIDVDDQSTDADPDRLDYRGLHVHIRASDLVGIDGRGIRCEVQIRTVAEHAWAETEHKYLYKKSNDIPADVRRVFRRLLALVELFDDELQRGVDLVRVHPSFAQHQIVRHLERKYAALTDTIGDELTTQEIVKLLAERGYEDVGIFNELVDTYLESHESEVRSLIDTHGPKSEAFDPDEDWLLSQPESLLLLALLDQDEYRLAGALRGEDLAAYVEALARWTDHPGFARL